MRPPPSELFAGFLDSHEPPLSGPCLVYPPAGQGGVVREFEASFAMVPPATGLVVNIGGSYDF